MIEFAEESLNRQISQEALKDWDEMPTNFRELFKEMNAGSTNFQELFKEMDTDSGIAFGEGVKIQELSVPTSRYPEKMLDGCPTLESADWDTFAVEYPTPCKWDTSNLADVTKDLPGCKSITRVPVELFKSFFKSKA